MRIRHDDDAMDDLHRHLFSVMMDAGMETRCGRPLSM